MTPTTLHTTTIQRLVEISVTVERIPGTAPTWHPPDPGDPDQYGIVQAMGPGEGAAFRVPVALTAAEQERAICQVIAATTKSDAASASDQLAVAIAAGERFGQAAGAFDFPGPLVSKGEGGDK